MSLINPTRTSYSPTTLIYLEIGEKQIPLADVLYNTATLYNEALEISSETKATLLISVNGDATREEVILEKGISPPMSRITFKYADTGNATGRHFSYT